MRALDTNLLVRLLIEDDPAQCERAAQVVSGSGPADERLFITTAALLELNWVLGSKYKRSREAVLAAFEQLAKVESFVFESPALLEDVIAERESGIEIADLIVGISARIAGCSTTLTFDKAAAKSNLFEEV